MICWKYMRVLRKNCDASLITIILLTSLRSFVGLESLQLVLWVPIGPYPPSKKAQISKRVILWFIFIQYIDSEDHLTSCKCIFEVRLTLYRLKWMKRNLINSLMQWMGVFLLWSTLYGHWFCKLGIYEREHITKVWVLILVLRYFLGKNM